MSTNLFSDNKQTKDFTSLLQYILEYSQNGIDSKIYEALWKMTGEKDLATVYLTLMLGKLTLMTDNYTDFTTENATQELNEKSFEEVINELRLVSHKENDSHPLLLGRKENIKKKFEDFLDLFSDEANLSPQQNFNRGALENSILYVAMFYRFDPSNPALLFSLDKYLEKNMKSRSFIAKEIKQAICPPVDVLYKYIQQVSSSKTVQFGESLSPTFSSFSALNNIPSFSYVRLQTIARIPKYTDYLLSEIIQVLLNKRDVKSCLLFLSLFLPQIYLTKSHELLGKLIQALKPFYLEPKPVGELAQTCLKSIKREIENPGILSRERFETSLCKPKESNKFEQRIVHVLFNPSSNNSQTINKLGLETEINEDEIKNSKANLILNVFEAMEQDDSQDLLNKSIEVLSNYYEKVSDATNGKSPNKDALIKIKQEILEDKTEGTKYCIRMRSPKVPPITFKIHTLPYEEDLKKVPKFQNSTQYKVDPISSIQPIIEDIVNEIKKNQIGELNLMVAGGSGTLQHVAHSLDVLVKLKKQLLEKLDIKLSILPLGVNNYLPVWMSNQDAWYSRHLFYPIITLLPVYPLQDGLQTSFPSKVYNQKGKKLIRTTVEPVTLSSYQFPRGYLTPHHYYKSLISDYLIDAKNSIPLHVYSVQCLSYELEEDKKHGQMKGNKIKEYVAVRFCQRIHIGVRAEALSFKKTNNIVDMSVDDIKNSKTFSFSKVPTTFEYEGADHFASKTFAQVKVEPKVYSSIDITSTGKSGDGSCYGNPSDNFLEVFCVEDPTTIKKKKKTTQPDQATQIHIKSLTISSSSSARFPIILDGEIYGPFHKIIIETTKALKVDVPCFEKL